LTSSHPYDGTYKEFKVTFKHFGINAKRATVTTPDAFPAAIDRRTKAIFIEKSLANDIPALAKVVQASGIPLIVDNT
jgi:O-acetylhomoserine/O-acetylserine sulfhydrylase